MSTQAHLECPKMHTYLLQPCDGTAYRFGFMDFAQLPQAAIAWDGEPTGERVNHMPVQETGQAKVLRSYEIFPGVNATYIRIFFMMDGSPSNGVVDICKDSLRDLNPGVIAYVSGKVPQVDHYTLVAILLALRELSCDPKDLNGSLHAMLQAPDYLRGWQDGEEDREVGRDD